MGEAPAVPLMEHYLTRRVESIIAKSTATGKVAEREARVKRIGILALAACAALALTATAEVGTAMAARFAKESGSTVRKGTSGETLITEIGCSGQTLSGSPSEFFGPTVSGATCIIGSAAPLKMNGCTFIFNPGAEESSGHFGGTFDIGPPGCGPMTIISAQCELSIYPKAGLTAHYRNVGEGTKSEVIAELSATGLKQTGKLAYCKGYNNEKGTWNATWNLKDYDSSGIQKGVHLFTKDGLYITGEESAEEQRQPKFHAEKYGADLAAHKIGENAIYLPAGWVECSTITGSGYLSEVTSSFVFQNLSYGGGCEALGRSATIKSEGCQYEFNLANLNSPYTGSQKLVCEAGRALEVVVYSSPGVTLCTVTLPSQTFGSVSYTSKGSGADRVVNSSTYGGELQYTISGGKGQCGAEGSHSDGETEGGMSFVATV